MRTVNSKGGKLPVVYIPLLQHYGGSLIPLMACIIDRHLAFHNCQLPLPSE